MDKLYRKNELWFALFWIFIYVFLASLADNISMAIGVDKSITFVLHLILSIMAFVWVKRNNLLEKYGLCKSAYPPSAYLYYIPLAVLSVCNLWFGVQMNMPLIDTLFYIGSMIAVGFLEELIFRGFLFKAMAKDGVKTAIIVSSITFGFGHIINLFNGSGMSLVSNLCQIGCAVALGFMFMIIFYKGKSLYPCIISHAVINCLSAFSNESVITDGVQIVFSLTIAIIAIVYTLILNKTLDKKKTIV